MRVFPEDFEQNTQRKMYDEIASKNNGPLKANQSELSLNTCHFFEESCRFIFFPREDVFCELTEGKFHPKEGDANCRIEGSRTNRATNKLPLTY